MVTVYLITDFGETVKVRWGNDFYMCNKSDLEPRGEKRYRVALSKLQKLSY